MKFNSNNTCCEGRVLFERKLRDSVKVLEGNYKMANLRSERKKLKTCEPASSLEKNPRFPNECIVCTNR